MGSTVTTKTRTIMLSILGVLVLVGIAAAVFGPRIYRDLIAAEPSAAPTIEASALEDSTLSDADLPGTWSVQSGSWVGYRVDEVLNGTDVTVTGRGEEVSGDVTVTDTQVSAGTFSVAVASIATDEANRDNYFRNTTMNVAAYPNATFTLTSPIDLPADPTAAVTQTTTATGDLTLAGQTVAVTVDITTALSGNTVILTGSVPITFSDFGITAPSLGFVSVEDSGAVEFELTLARS